MPDTPHWRPSPPPSADAREPAPGLAVWRWLATAGTRGLVVDGGAGEGQGADGGEVGAGGDDLGADGDGGFLGGAGAEVEADRGVQAFEGRVGDPLGVQPLHPV